MDTAGIPVQAASGLAGHTPSISIRPSRRPCKWVNLLILPLVLLPQRWEEHNQQLRQQQQQQSHPSQHAFAPAAAAVAAWAGVGKTARAALKSANVHSVLELETQVLELMEQVGASHRVPCSVRQPCM